MRKSPRFARADRLSAAYFRAQRSAVVAVVADVEKRVGILSRRAHRRGGEGFSVSQLARALPVRRTPPPHTHTHTASKNRFSDNEAAGPFWGATGLSVIIDWKLDRYVDLRKTIRVRVDTNELRATSNLFRVQH